MEQTQSAQWLVAASIIGPFAGAAVGWILTEIFSPRLRRRRAAAEARFEVVRGLLRYRTSSELSYYLNEIPLFFGEDEIVMRLWRDLAHGRVKDREVVLTQLVIAAVRHVGIGHLEESDYSSYIEYDPEANNGH